MSIILGVHCGEHDASACVYDDFKLVSAVSLERLTRSKNAGISNEEPFPNAAIDEVLSVAGLSRSDVDVVSMSRASFEYQNYRLSGVFALDRLWHRLRGKTRRRLMDNMMRKERTRDAASIFRGDEFLKREGFPKAAVHFYNHHLGHGLAAYFYSGFDEALIHTADGIGDNTSYSARVARGGHLEVLFGDDDELFGRPEINSLGLLYGHFTRALGFISNRHEGKLVGLAGYGKPVIADRILAHFDVTAEGRITSDFPGYKEMAAEAEALCREVSREDAAASVQHALEVLMARSIEAVQNRTGMRNLAVGGGVYANVKLNRHILENTPTEAIFVIPAMGDDGLPLGGCLAYLHETHGAEEWNRNRRPLTSMCLGRGDARPAAAVASQFPHATDLGAEDRETVVSKIVDALIEGKAVGLHEGRMEFGPRALGARSIIAAPVKHAVNESLNTRLSRSDFMPFAPVVLAEHAAEVFDIHAGNAHPAQFMTITCNVKPEWRDRIPAVVHVDGSARPQTVAPDAGTFYRRILEVYHERTGLPVLINTSFNVHEEPIIDTPEQAFTALVQNRVDLLLLGGRLFAPAAEPEFILREAAE